MTVEEKIYQILSASAGVTALVPAGRIKPPGDWQGLEKPYITHFPVDGETTQCSDGQKALRIWGYYQVSIFATDHGRARAIAAAVEAALDGYQDADTNRIALLRPPMPMPAEYDTDLKVTHLVMDFFVGGGLT